MTSRAHAGPVRVMALLLVTALAACGLPRSGPYYEEITASAENDPDFDLIEVTPQLIQAVNVDESLGFDMRFIEAEPEKTAIFGVGDVLQITIWERGEEGIFTPLGGATSLTAEIEEDGAIYLPYIGSVRAAGRTAAGMRRALVEVLSDRTLDPQVEVKRETGDSKSITITGTAGVAGIVPVERTTRSLLSLLAGQGFAVPDPEVVRVTVRRGPVEGTIWMRELFENPEFDVPVRAGDVIFLNLDTRHFRALGAVGQSRVPFPTRDISVLDALTLIGGLNPARSDPTGVFVFRTEPPEVAVQVSEKATVDQPRKIAYLFDLTKGTSLFLADQMKMRDNDLIYVTDAPFTRFQIVAGAVASTIGFAGSVTSVQSNF